MLWRWRISFAMAKKYGENFKSYALPGHLRAMRDIENCRTEVMGVMSTSVKMRPARRWSTPTTPVKIGTAPNAITTRLSSGSKNNATAYCRFLLPGHSSPSPGTESNRPVQPKGRLQHPLSILGRRPPKLALDPRFVGGRIGMIGVASNLGIEPGLSSPYPLSRPRRGPEP